MTNRMFLLLATMLVATVAAWGQSEAPKPSSSAPSSSAPSSSSPSSSSPSAATRDQIYGRLAGAWTGQLEYRDFQTDKHVALPTWLDIKPAADGTSLQFTYTYDDGPNKTVTEHSTVRIDPANHLFVITSDRDHSSETYQIGGLVDPLPAGRIQFALSGKGTENNKSVDVRISVTVGRNLYQYTKETRQGGEDFKFRDGYTFTRRNPPK